jgi:hypothetical protein
MRLFFGRELAIDGAGTGASGHDLETGAGF